MMFPLLQVGTILSEGVTNKLANLLYIIIVMIN